MVRSKNSRIKIIFLVAVVFLISLSIFSYLRINSLIKSTQYVNQTNAVKFQLQEFYSEVLTAESLQRGYLITKEDYFTQKYNRSLVQIDVHLDRLRLLSNDNYSQRRNLDQLKQLLSQRKFDMNRNMSVSNYLALPKDIRMKSRNTMQDLHLQIKKMMNEEDVLLRIRMRTLLKDSTLTPLFTFLIIIASIVVLLGSYYLIFRELKISNRLRLEVLEQNTGLEAMNAELESFTYISSHDLQEPLRKIQIFVTRIIDKESNSLSQESLAYMLRTKDSANRMQNLIQDLLAYSRLKTESFLVEKIDISEMINDVKDDLSEEIASSGAIIKFNGVDSVFGISTQFRQLITNLVSNSIKFVRAGVSPIITIDNQEISGAQIVNMPANPILTYNKITIADNGIGFDEQYKKRIFEVFQRLHSQNEYIGTGIGLAIVKKIMENHHGFVSAESPRETGAVFTMYFPKLNN